MPLKFTASHRHARIAPRKARYVMDLVRGKSVNEAMRLLEFTPRRAAPMILQVLKSAVANAGETALRERLNLDVNKLVVESAYADASTTFKRWRPRSRGMANQILKRNSHLHVVLASADDDAMTPIGERGKRKRKRADPEVDTTATETTATETTDAAEAEAESEASAEVESSSPDAEATKADESTAVEASADSPDATSDSDSDPDSAPAEETKE